MTYPFINNYLINMTKFYKYIDTSCHKFLQVDLINIDSTEKIIYETSFEGSGPSWSSIHETTKLDSTKMS